MFIKSNSTNLSGNSRGFTLLEILIAVFILATVLSTVYAAYSGTFRIFSVSAEDREIYGMARNTMERIRKDFAALSTADGRFRFIARASAAAGSRFVDLTFISRAHLAFSEKEIPSGLAEVTYYVEEDRSREGYRLMRKDVLYAESGERKESHVGFPLCEGIQSLLYRFTDTAGNERELWDSEAGAEGDRNKVPATVAIELNLRNEKDEERPYRFATRLFLPASTIAPPPQ